VAGIASNGVYFNNLTTAPTAGIPSGHWLLYSKNEGLFAISMSGAEVPIDSSAVLAAVADTSSVLQGHIDVNNVAIGYLASVTGGFALTVDVAGLTGSLYSLIGATSGQGGTPSLSGYTTLAATSALTGVLQSQITADQVAIGYLSSVTGGFALTTSLQTTAGNLVAMINAVSGSVSLAQVAAASGNALAQANAYTNAVSGSLSSAISGVAAQLGSYALTTTVAGLTGSLQSQVTNNNVAIGYLASVTGGFALTTSLQLTAGNIAVYSAAASANALAQANSSTSTQLASYTTLAATNALTGQLALDANTVHKTGIETIAGQKTFSNDVIVNGNFTVNGSTTTVTSQNLLVSNNVIVVNNGGTAPVAAGFAGMEVQRGPVATSAYFFVFEEARGGFVVGLSGQTQLVASREDSPIAAGIAYWDGSNFRFDTNSTLTSGSIVNLQNAVSYLASVSGGFAQSVDVAALTGQLALNANVVHITGNETISGSKVFVTLSTLSQSVNNFTVKSITGASQIVMDGISGANRRLLLRSSGSNRWIFGADATTEAGADSGTNFFLSAFNDVGSTIDTPLAVNRATGSPLVTSRPMNISGQATAFNIVSVNGISANGNLPVVTTDMLAALSGSGNGISSTAVAALTGQLVLKAGDTMTGLLTIADSVGNGLSIQTVSGSNGPAIQTAHGNFIKFLPQAGASNYNPLVQNNDAALIFSQGASDTGSLVLGPHAATAKGIRIDQAGNVVMTGGISGAGSVPVALRTDVAALTAQLFSVYGGVISAAPVYIVNGTIPPGAFTTGTLTLATSSTNALTAVGLGGNVFRFYAYSGSSTAPSSTTAGTQIFTLNGLGHDEVNWVANRVSITSLATTQWTSASHETNLKFLTTAKNTVAGTDKMAIWGDGSVQIGGTISNANGGLGANNLVVAGNISAAGSVPVALRTDVAAASGQLVLKAGDTMTGNLTISVTAGSTITLNSGASQLSLLQLNGNDGRLAVVSNNGLDIRTNNITRQYIQSGGDTTFFGNLYVNKGNPFLGIQGTTREWDLQSVDSDGRFRIYDGTGNVERFSLYPNGGMIVYAGISANGNLPVVTTDMLAALSGAGGGVSSATVAALTGQLVKKAGDTMTGLFELSNSVTVPPIELVTSDISSGFRLVGDQAQKQIHQYSYGVNNAGYRMVTVDGSAGAPANIANGRLIGQVIAFGRYGAGLYAGSKLSWIAEQPFAASGAGTAFHISYVPINTVAPVDFLYMTATDNTLRLSTTISAASNLIVAGQISGANGQSVAYTTQVAALSGLLVAKSGDVMTGSLTISSGVSLSPTLTIRGFNDATKDLTFKSNNGLADIDAGANGAIRLNAAGGKVGIGKFPSATLDMTGTFVVDSGNLASAIPAKFKGGAGTSIVIDATQGGGSEWHIGDAIGAANGTFVIYDYPNSKAVLNYDNNGNFNLPNSSTFYFGSQALKNHRTSLGTQYITDVFYNGNTPTSQIIADCNNGDFYIDVSGGRNFTVRSGVNGISGTMFGIVTDAGFVTRTSIGASYNKGVVSLGSGAGLDITFDGSNGYLQTQTGALVMQTTTANPAYIKTNGAVAATFGSNQVVDFALSPSISGVAMGNTATTHYYVQSGTFSDPGGNNGDVVYVI
jgi:hypothetical protein